ncbi:MAG: stage III sporulation protein AD [Clostridia bacterium]|nr:stage III sporulation protein AD [Clostridia bacterium]
MDITKIIVIAIISIVIIALLKQYKPEFAIYASIITGIIILYFVIREFTPVVVLLKNLSEKMGVSSKFFIILLKITGVAYISEFGSSVCKDSGETAIASKVELAGKILIISLSIPIITTLMETLLGLV